MTYVVFSLKNQKQMNALVNLFRLSGPYPAIKRQNSLISSVL